MRCFWLPICGIMALAGIAAPAATAPAQFYQEYQSWIAACDNTQSCVAKAVSLTNHSEILISREAGPNGATELKLTASPGFSVGQIRVDGKRLDFPYSAWRIVTRGDITTASISDKATVRAVVAQFRHSKTLTLGSDHTLPLDGIYPALWHLDDLQGQIDTKTSFVRLGDRPASAVPAARSLPVKTYRPVRAPLSKGEAKRLVTALQARWKQAVPADECDDSVPARYPRVYPLDARHALILTRCILGAYQTSYLAFISARSDGSVVRMETDNPYLGGDPEYRKISLFAAAIFDARTSELGTFYKGRGLADCGSTARWIWNGTAFVLSHFAYQQVCGGLRAHDWPVLFRSAH